MRLGLNLAGGTVQPSSDSATLAETLWNSTPTEPPMAWLEDACLAARAIIGFGADAQEWGWRGCHH